MSLSQAGGQRRREDNEPNSEEGSQLSDSQYLTDDWVKFLRTYGTCDVSAIHPEIGLRALQSLRKQGVHTVLDAVKELKLYGDSAHIALVDKGVSHDTLTFLISGIRSSGGKFRDNFIREFNAFPECRDLLSQFRLRDLLDTTDIDGGELGKALRGKHIYNGLHFLEESPENLKEIRGLTENKFRKIYAQLEQAGLLIDSRHKKHYESIRR